MSYISSLFDRILKMTILALTFNVFILLLTCYLFSDVFIAFVVLYFFIFLFLYLDHNETNGISSNCTVS